MSLEARLPLFPVTASVVPGPAGDELAINDRSLAALADEFGTPLYVYDQATMDRAVDEYRRSLAAHYAGASGITLAGKAFLCVAAAQWAQEQGLRLDCTGRGELRVAAAAGVDRAAILVHGVNKSDADLAAAVRQAGVMVVDNLSELQRLAALLDPIAPAARPDLWLRVRPGVAVDTHAYRQTGQEDSKFGMGAQEIIQAVRLCIARSLPLTGLHFHQGSHFHDPAPIGPALELVLDLAEELHTETGWLPGTVCPGGGWGVAYHEHELPHPPIEDYVAFVAARLAESCNRRGLPLPRLQMEPGRSLVARAGVAVYRAGAVKQSPQRRWLLIDGGLADNPRPALYGARYSALPVSNPARPPAGLASLAGPYCESGDILLEDLPLPALQAGELIAVPVSGAYHLSMGSNYNGACRPAVVWLNAGQAHLIQRREDPDDLIARDIPLPRRRD